MGLFYIYMGFFYTYMNFVLPSADSVPYAKPVKETHVYVKETYISVKETHIRVPNRVPPQKKHTLKNTLCTGLDEKITTNETLYTGLFSIYMVLFYKYIM